ncbi:uncharacterized protein BJ171DRAFT_494238 [Polychytrium aggregatum]|uniref:uncharacterized protein n=1 Tax=Polychytrium aggregatum TaxID=110093 RepID=UPI0022FE6278|nr:uncharacterized protein BJ171DRAFT_494238 [Polychytrium aggregatum]KAI9207319.1 hypothetical protein BJ171DRAFT_494238 [Polychytrium aggregatum]
MATIHPLNVSKQQVLSVYRGLLREVNKQFTRTNQNLLWKTELTLQFRLAQSLESPEEIQRRFLDAKNTLTHLHAVRTHKHMMATYWPASGLTGQEKIERTAGKVGLALPEIQLNEEEADREASLFMVGQKHYKKDTLVEEFKKQQRQE